MGLSGAFVDLVRHSRMAQVTLLATTLGGAGLGMAGLGAGGAPEQTPQPTRPPATAPATAGATATAKAAALDVCTLVTTAEASAILGRPVTATQVDRANCAYKPETPAEFRVSTEDGGAATIRVDRVMVTVLFGAEAASRYASKEAIFGRDPEDERVNGLGDKAIYTRGTDLSVLQGSSYVSVGTLSERTAGAGRVFYESVRQKYIGILEAFARPALQRITVQPTAATAVPTTAPTAAQQTAAAQPTPAAQAAAADRGANVGGALAGAVAGLALGALAVLGLALRTAPAAAPVDTGHYDDGHSFGWDARPAEAATEPIDPGPAHGKFIDGLAALASPPASSGPQLSASPGVEQPTLPAAEVFAPRPRTMERPDPCKESTAEAQALLEQLRSAREENRAAMQRALNAFFGPKASQYNEGYANAITSSKITEAVVKANNETGKVLIDVALFAAGGWGGIAGKGSSAAGVFGEGLAGAKTVGDAWGKVGIKVAGKVADAFIGDKAGTAGSATYKFVEKAVGEHGYDASKAFQGPAGAIESIVRDKIIGALGDWMKDGAMAGDVARARDAYADFVAAAAVANTTEGAARELKRQIDEINARLRARNCPEVSIPDHVFYTFDLTQFGEGMFEGQKGPTMHAKNIASGTDRTTDLFAKVKDSGSLPF